MSQREDAIRNGRNEYFTGRACRHGHVSPRRVVDHVCVECHRLKQIAWKRGHRDVVNERARARYRAMRPRSPHYDVGLPERRRRAIRKATPSWVDHTIMRAVYETAAEESIRLGRKIVVDHIVPLKGRTVCGLHVPANLRLVSESFFRVRRGKFDRESASATYFKSLKQAGL